MENNQEEEEYWSEFSFSPPGYLPNPGIELMSPAPPALAGRFFTTKPLLTLLNCGAGEDS